MVQAEQKAEQKRPTIEHTSPILKTPVLIIVLFEISHIYWNHTKETPLTPSSLLKLLILVLQKYYIAMTEHTNSYNHLTQIHHVSQNHHKRYNQLLNS